MTKRSVKTKETVLEEFRCASIQDAAMSVIARKGIDAATMQEIAAEAGIAKGTIYAYFRDRDELLAKTATGAYERLVAELETAFTAPGTLEDRLRGVVLRQLQFFDDNRELFRAYRALSHLDTSKRKQAAHARYIERVERMFAEARERGEIRGVDPHELAAVYADCVRGVVIRRIEEKSKTSREEQAALIVALLLRGISGEKQ
jgi:AcrR family transcriptional regulator